MELWDGFWITYLISKYEFIKLGNLVYFLLVNHSEPPTDFMIKFHWFCLYSLVVGCLSVLFSSVVMGIKRGVLGTYYKMLFVQWPAKNFNLLASDLMIKHYFNNI